jgi:hypothetical protein
MAITTLFKSIQDIMRQDAGVDGDTRRISQLVWMFFRESSTTKSSNTRSIRVPWPDAQC